VTATALPSGRLDRSVAARLGAARRAEARRARVVGVALTVVGFLAFCVSISVGDFPVPLRDVVPAIFGVGSDDAEFIVGTLRMPRALVGALVGAAFGVSGAIFQALARNPLASPDVIGITAGASTAAVAIIVLVGASTAVVSLGAFVGALATAAAIYLLAWRQGVSSYRLVLVGIGIGAMLASVTSYLLTRAEIFDAARATVWLTGSLNGRGWDEIRPVVVALAVLLPAALALARPLRTLQLGDDTAAGLGVPVERVRAGLVVVGVGLAAVATAAAGPIAFVAFVSAPIARRLVRSSLTIVPAALAGATLVLLADLAARRLFAPVELPVGIVTGIIGAPYLLWLIARANRIGRGG
jgi:iron complex transport system permease protein